MNLTEASAHPPKAPSSEHALARARRAVRHPRTTLALALAFAAPACSRQPEEPQPRIDEAQLRAELMPVVRDELRRELRPVIMEELRRELTPSDGTHRPPAAGTPGSEPMPETRPASPADATPPVRPPEPPPTNPPEPARPTDADTPPTPNTNPLDPQSDLWSRPGTTIWPSPGGLRLVELAVGTGLEDKLPVGIESHYQQVPEILYCYTVFENPGPDQTVTHVWRRSGRLVSRVELEVGKSPKWRTWSKQRVAPHWRGVWSCEVLSPEGTQLGLHVFQVGG